jgi:ParB family chromosome partitioning protein
VAETQKRKGLGRGLAALIDGAAAASEAAETAAAAASEIAIDLIAPNPDQPRKAFDQAELESLAASIREKGVIQPLILRPDPRRPGGYEIVAGERRWRAAQLAQRHAVPAIVRQFSDAETLEVALLENVQRADLNPVEEAAGYAQLIERHGHTQERLAAATGKSRSHIANTLRLLNLPAEALALLRDGAITAGHARAALAAPDPGALARAAAAEGLSVRETERRAKAPPPRPAAAPAGPGRPGKDADTAALEADLSAALGLRVAIRHGARGDGEVVLRYRDLDQLDRICQLLGGG